MCECKCELNKSVHNSKRKWNHDECWCEFRKLDEWGSCKTDYVWNPSTCDCECNKACKSDEYLDTKKCSCKKRLFDKISINMRRWDNKYN